MIQTKRVGSIGIEKNVNLLKISFENFDEKLPMIAIFFQRELLICDTVELAHGKIVKPKLSKSDLDSLKLKLQPF